MIRSTYKDKNDKRDVISDTFDRLKLEALIAKTKLSRYEEAYNNNGINIPDTVSKTTVETQTVGMNTDGKVVVPNQEVVSSLSGFERSSRSVRPLYPVRPTMVNTSSSPIFNEQDKMSHEDESSRLMQYKDAIIDLNTSINETKQAYLLATTNFKRLKNSNRLSKAQIIRLNIDLNSAYELRTLTEAHIKHMNSDLESRGIENKLLKGELENALKLKEELEKGSNMYNVLAHAYETLRNNAIIIFSDNSKKSESIDYYKTLIDDLKRSNAEETAALVAEFQHQIDYQSSRHEKESGDVSWKNEPSLMTNKYNNSSIIRNYLNTEKKLFCKAASPDGIVYRKIQIFKIRGSLIRRTPTTEDKDVDANTPGIKKIDFIWSYIASIHDIPNNTNMSEIDDLVDQYQQIENNGVPTTVVTRADLEPISDPALAKNPNKHPRSASMVSDSHSPPPSQPKKTAVEAIVIYKAPIGHQASLGSQSPGLAPLGPAYSAERLGLPKLRGSGSLHTPLRYKQLGGTMINIKSLHGGILSLRHASNPKAMYGKVQNMSKSLTSLVKTLVYDGKVDKDAYYDLGMSDKATFDDILKKSSLVYSEKNWDDPKDVLMAEYQKLAGEVEINNDNPEIKKKLRKVITTMFACGMVKQKRYEEIIDMLI